jgi:hypothetical protein
VAKHYPKEIDHMTVKTAYDDLFAFSFSLFVTLYFLCLLRLSTSDTNAASTLRDHLFIRETVLHFVLVSWGKGMGYQKGMGRGRGGRRMSLRNVGQMRRMEMYKIVKSSHQ